jgi:hypothetical protein
VCAYARIGVYEKNVRRYYKLTVWDVFGRSYSASITKQESDDWMSSQHSHAMNLLTLFDYSNVPLTVPKTAKAPELP